MHKFQEGNFTQEGFKEELVKRTSSQIVASIDAMTGKQESKVMKCFMVFKVSHY